MLTSNEKHEWSNDGVTWQKPGYWSTDHNGGSAGDWPKVNVEGDERKYPSFWGDERSNLKGGCCSGSLTEYLTGNHWGQPFSMAYGVPFVSVAYMEEQITAAVAAAVATEKAAASTIIAERDSTIALKEGTIATLTSNLSTCNASTVELAVALAGADAEKNATIATQQRTITTITSNLSTCTTALEAKRLARLAETAEDQAAFDQSDVPVQHVVDDPPSPIGTIVGVGAFIIAALLLMLYSRKRTHDAAATVAAAAAGALDRNAVVAVQNPAFNHRLAEGVAAAAGDAAEVPEYLEADPTQMALYDNGQAPGAAGIVPPQIRQLQQAIDASVASGGAIYAVPFEDDAPAAAHGGGGGASRVELDADMYVAGGAPPVVPTDAGTYANAGIYQANGAMGGGGEADASLYSNVPGSSTNA
jgi:hypothetical protein